MALPPVAGPQSLGQIPAPPPIQAPPVAPYQPPAPFGYAPTSPGTFTGTAPKAQPVTPFNGSGPQAQPMGGFTGTAPVATTTGSFGGGPATAAFTAPDPTNFQTDPSYQWRLSQGLTALDRGAAARGTLLTGGTLKASQDYGQNAASQEYGNAYNRALQTYGTNRDTNQQNFGQSLATYGTNRDTNAQNFSQGQTGFQDTLAGYDANRATNAQNFGQKQTSYQDALAGYDTNRQTAAQNAEAQQQQFQDALTGFKTNADTTLAANAQGLGAAEAGYDRNASASDRSQQLATEDAMRRTGVLNANNASTYQTQMLNYELQQEQQRQLQQQGIDNAQRNSARMQQQQDAENERRRQAMAAGQTPANAASNAFSQGGGTPEYAAYQQWLREQRAAQALRNAPPPNAASGGAPIGASF